MVCSAAVRALQTLEEPLGVTAGTKQPPGPELFVQEGEIRFPTADRAKSTAPLLLVNQSCEGLYLSSQKRLYGTVNCRRQEILINAIGVCPGR